MATPSRYADPDPRHHRHHTLPDGRTLGYADWAAESGLTVFDFHGGPGCRLVPSGLPKFLASLDLRWITVDRPGLGLSDPHPNRTLADWPQDVAQLADGLGIGTFAVVGWSMGGPYAAATAAVLGDRVTAAALLAPAPLDAGPTIGTAAHGKAEGWQLALDDPWTTALLYTAYGLEFRRNPTVAAAMLADGCSSSEREVLARPDVEEILVRMMIEATRQGAVGLVEDMRVLLAPWRVHPMTISQRVHVWEGDDDSWSLPGVAAEWVAAIPDAVLHTVAGEGHFFPFTHIDDVVRALRVDLATPTERHRERGDECGHAPDHFTVTGSNAIRV